jgi:hypothetical protein
MFVRFRQNGRRQQVSLLETRRADGRVRNEHVASLGSVELPQTVEARLVFWRRLHERLAKLSNRIDAATQGKILTDIHARVPMVTLDEQRDLQLRNAEADEQLWTTMRSLSEDNLADLRQLVGQTERNMDQIKPLIANADAKATIARDRVEKLKKGEALSGGLGKPRTREDVIAALGLSKRDVRRCLALAELCQSESDREAVQNEITRATHRSREATIFRMLRAKQEEQ